MNFVKISSALLLMAAFGGIARADTSSNWARDRYEQLSAAELQVALSANGSEIVGTSTRQKNDSDGSFCREVVAMYPGARPEYACFTPMVAGREAARLYKSQNVTELNAMFYHEGYALLGSSWNEKFIAGSNYGDLLCVKTGAVVPRPKYKYVCYTNLPPIGGGVSVGN